MGLPNQASNRSKSDFCTLFFSISIQGPILKAKELVHEQGTRSSTAGKPQSVSHVHYLYLTLVLGIPVYDISVHSAAIHLKCILCCSNRVGTWAASSDHDSVHIRRSYPCIEYCCLYYMYRLLWSDDYVLTILCTDYIMYWLYYVLTAMHRLVQRKRNSFISQ